VEQGVIGLVSGLRRLAGDEQYVLLTLHDEDDWIAPYAEGFAERVPTESDPQGPPRRHGLRRAFSSLPFLRAAWRALPRRATLDQVVPRSNAVLEGVQPAVMHFTFQSGFRTEIPSIYQPWDLQHVHLPQFFTAWERAARELTYGYLCDQAEIVVVASEWARRDVTSHFGLPDTKVHVIPVGPLVELFDPPTEAQLSQARSTYALPEQFALFPAQTFPHKNHLALLEALAVLRDRDDLVIPLVCAGKLNNHFPKIEKRRRQLRLTESVRFLDYVDPSLMPSLYRLSRCLVFPSKFEGWGMPVHEAFHAGVPVACSTATSLPEVAGDAAVMFEPDDVEAMAEALARVWLDEGVRSDLVERGYRQVRSFSLERTAMGFRTRYRLLAGCQLSGEEERLLEPGAGSSHVL
jgi:glycosyltransferase involved in cell wall biosynthesis